MRRVIISLCAFVMVMAAILRGNVVASQDGYHTNSWHSKEVSKLLTTKYLLFVTKEEKSPRRKRLVIHFF